MSLLYRDVRGAEHPISGLNSKSGELVPSVSYYQTGVATITETIPANSYKAVDVTFANAMPDKDYCVVFAQHTRANTHSDAWGQTAEGFRVYMYNDTDEDMVPSDARPITVTWRAFKLMTDESRAIDEQAIATNTADIATINDNGVLKIQRNGEISDCNAAIPPKAGMAMWWGTSTTTANIPANGYGSIVVLRTGTTVKQYWFRNGVTMEYSRSIECDNDGNYASTNSDWVQMATANDITDSATTVSLTFASGFTDSLGKSVKYFAKSRRICFVQVGAGQASGTNIQAGQALFTITKPTGFDIPSHGMMFVLLLRNTSTGEEAVSHGCLQSSGTAVLTQSVGGLYNEFRILGVSIFSAS